MFDSINPISKFTIELIDTWWDVNNATSPNNCLPSSELIDTWWDVN